MYVFWLHFLLALVFLCVGGYLIAMGTQLDQDDDKQKAWIYANYGVGGLCGALMILFIWIGIFWAKKTKRGEVTKTNNSTHAQIVKSVIPTQQPVQYVPQPVQYVPQPTAPQIVQHVHTINPN